MAQKLIYDNKIFFGGLKAVCSLYLRLSGWKPVGTLPEERKFVAIAAPHTSNWDFPTFMCLVGYFAMRVRFLGKDTLFKGPFGWFFYWLGGIPVERDTKAAAAHVGKAVEAFARNDEFILGIAPEGTRSSVTKWKTGFYRIAVEADVPILLAYLDGDKKEVGLSHMFYPTGDMDGDLAEIQAFYADKPGINRTTQPKTEPRDS